MFNHTVLLIQLFCMIDFHWSHFLNLFFPIETYCLYECRPLSSVTKSKLLVVAMWPNWNVNQTKLVVGPERAPGAGQPLDRVHSSHDLFVSHREREQIYLARNKVMAGYQDPRGMSGKWSYTHPLSPSWSPPTSPHQHLKIVSDLIDHVRHADAPVVA